ncbi:hypothetical protein R3P38DRAFT_3194817 [Favolaschia claudopus]|uniref:Uncharacterized protein n=1 Tax=Favolaschia claudopus TaxID=2862362 RepID=A0AAW0BDF3_9AGAR
MALAPPVATLARNSNGHHSSPTLGALYAGGSLLLGIPLVSPRWPDEGAGCPRLLPLALPTTPKQMTSNPKPSRPSSLSPPRPTATKMKHINITLSPVLDASRPQTLLGIPFAASPVFISFSMPHPPTPTIHPTPASLTTSPSTRLMLPKVSRYQVPTPAHAVLLPSRRPHSTRHQVLLTYIQLRRSSHRLLTALDNPAHAGTAPARPPAVIK